MMMNNNNNKRCVRLELDFYLSRLPGNDYKIKSSVSVIKEISSFNGRNIFLYFIRVRCFNN